MLLAAATLVVAVAGRPARWVLPLVTAAFALWLAGVAFEALAAATKLDTAPPVALVWPVGIRGPGPDELLRRHPRTTLRWLRGCLGLDRETFAAHLGTSPARVASWEDLGRAIEPRYQRRLLPLLSRQLATPEGAAFARTLGRDEAAAG